MFSFFYFLFLANVFMNLDEKDSKCDLSLNCNIFQWITYFCEVQKLLKTKLINKPCKIFCQWTFRIFTETYCTNLEIIWKIHRLFSAQILFSDFEFLAIDFLLILEPTQAYFQDFQTFDPHFHSISLAVTFVLP